MINPMVTASAALVVPFDWRSLTPPPWFLIQCTFAERVPYQSLSRTHARVQKNKYSRPTSCGQCNFDSLSLSINRGQFFSHLSTRKGTWPSGTSEYCVYLCPRLCLTLVTRSSEKASHVSYPLGMIKTREHNGRTVPPSLPNTHSTM